MLMMMMASCHASRRACRPTALVLVLLLLLLPVVTRAQCTCDTQPNRDVLLRFRAATGGAWTVTTTLPLCSWGRIVTCTDADVTGVDLKAQPLSGNLSASLPFNLTGLVALKLLDVSQTSLLGSIGSFALPPSLEVLRLGSEFTGSLEPLRGLPYLTEFSCHQCGLQGPLPTSWCADGPPGVAMQRLQAIQLSGNSKLVGPLPASWASCPLTLVDVSGVRSAGSVPPSWADPQQPMASTIVRLRLGSSGLVGAVPAAWFAAASFPVLQEVSAPSNGLNGSLPTNVTSTSLATLDLSDNVLEGPLPRVLSVAMVTLSVARNRLSGELPAVLPRTLILLDLSDNVALSGSIPSAWSEGPQAPALQQILLGGCNLSGAVPQAWLYSSTVRESLTTLNISHNQLSGVMTLNTSLPTTLRFLSLLDVSWNAIGGAFPLFGNAGAARVDVSHNQLIGPLPNVVPSQYFDASWNKLSGSLVAWNVEVLYVDLSHNLLSGTIPASSPCVLNAAVLNLSHNYFTGVVPRSVAAAATSVDVSWNLLTLPLPDGGALGLINVLDVSHNALKGPVVALQPLQTSLISIDLSFNDISSIVVPRASSSRVPTQLVPCAPNLQTLRIRNASLVELPNVIPDSIWSLDVSWNVRLSSGSGNTSSANILSGFWRWSFGLRSVDLSHSPNAVLQSIPLALCGRLRGVEHILIAGLLLPFPQIQLNLIGTSVAFRGSIGSSQVVTSASTAQAWIESWCATLSQSTAATASLALTQSRRVSESHSVGTSSRSPTIATRRVSVSLSNLPSATQNSSRSTTLSRSLAPSPSSSITVGTRTPSPKATSTASVSHTTRVTMTYAVTVSATASLPTISRSVHRVSASQSINLRPTKPREISVPTILSVGAAGVVALLGVSQAGAFVAVAQGAKATSTLRDRCSNARRDVNTSMASRDALDASTASAPFSDLMDSPTTLSIPFEGAPAGVKNAAGAVVGNFALIVAVPVLLRCWSAVKVVASKCRLRKQTTNVHHIQQHDHLLIGTRLPGGLMGLFLILLLPSTAAVVYICAGVASSSSEMSSGAIAALSAIGAAGTVLFLGPVVVVSVYVARRVDVLVMSHAVEADPMDSLQLQWSNSWAARGRRLLRWLTYHRTHWTARSVDAPDSDVGGSHAASVEFALRYGQIFGVYNGGFRHFFLVEFGVVICSGAVLGSALSAADACAALTWGGVVLAALSGGLGASHLYLLPTTARLESLSIALVALLTCAAELTISLSDSDVAELFLTATAILEVALVVTGVLADVVPRVCDKLFPHRKLKYFRHNTAREVSRRLRRLLHRPLLHLGGRVEQHQRQADALSSVLELIALSQSGLTGAAARDSLTCDDDGPQLVRPPSAAADGGNRVQHHSSSALQRLIELATERRALWTTTSPVAQ